MGNSAWREALPAIGKRRIALRVTPAAQKQVRSGHPWIFDNSITEQSHAGAAGDLAVVFDQKRRFQAIGLYDPTSPIRVRLLQHRTPAVIDESWLYTKMAAAAALRATLPSTGTDGYRLVHGENDGLPALVVDRYGATLVVKLYSVAWIPTLPALADALARIQPHERLVLRLARTVQMQRTLCYGLSDGQILVGQAPEEPLIFRENGIRFAVDPVYGQKTGFFLDQRENRARVESLTAPNCEVLNVFAYSGGFSLYAARGGAHSVTSLDSSRPALDAAEQNFALNDDNPSIRRCQHRIMAADAFDALRLMVDEGRHFDLVVIDPPAFAKRRSEYDAAVAAYRRLVDAGARLVRSQGVLVMASCSSRVPAEDFYGLVHAQLKRQNQLFQPLERAGHALDHPIGFDEGAYLKCIFLHKE